MRLKDLTAAFETAVRFRVWLMKWRGGTNALLSHAPVPAVINDRRHGPDQWGLPGCRTPVDSLPAPLLSRPLDWDSFSLLLLLMEFRGKSNTAQLSYQGFWQSAKHFAKKSRHFAKKWCLLSLLCLSKCAVRSTYLVTSLELRTPLWSVVNLPNRSKVRGHLQLRPLLMHICTL